MIIIIALTVILIIVMLIAIAIHYNNLAMFMFKMNYISLTSGEKWSLYRFNIITLVASMAIVVPIHEFIHLLSNIRVLDTNVRMSSTNKIFIVLNFPFSISICYDYWRTKTQTIKSYLSPFLYISIILIILYILVENPMLQTMFLMSFFTNIIGSVFDIVNAGWVFIAAPKGLLFYRGFILPPSSVSK
jgi:hypothetical protein